MVQIVFSNIGQVWVTSDFTNTINPFTFPVVSNFPLASGILKSSSTNRYLVSLNSTSISYQDMTIGAGPTFPISFGGSGTLTFDQEATTQIAHVVNSGFFCAKYFPEVDFWIMKGATLSGGSSWYQVSPDFSQYWNLSFSAGDADQPNGPVVDATTGSLYTVSSSGQVFISGAFPSLVPLIPGLPYPMHECYRGMLVPKRKC
jgi:hypothetical protein